MSHEHRHDEDISHPPVRRHRRPLTEIQPKVEENRPQGLFTKDDLSYFLSIKPYLTEKAQTIVDLLAEMHKTGGRFDPASLGRLLGMLGGGDNPNLAALTSLAGMTGGGGKIDPTALATLLGTLNQANLGRENPGT